MAYNQGYPGYSSQGWGYRSGSGSGGSADGVYQTGNYSSNRDLGHPQQYHRNEPQRHAEVAISSFWISPQDTTPSLQPAQSGYRVTLRHRQETFVQYEARSSPAQLPQQGRDYDRGYYQSWTDQGGCGRSAGPSEAPQPWRSQTHQQWWGRTTQPAQGNTRIITSERYAEELGRGHDDGSKFWYSGKCLLEQTQTGDLYLLANTCVCSDPCRQSGRGRFLLNPSGNTDPADPSSSQAGYFQEILELLKKL